MATPPPHSPPPQGHGDSFDAFYAAELEPLLIQLDARRKKLVKEHLIWVAAVLLAAIAIFLTSIAPLGAIVIMLGLILVYIRLKNKVNRPFKEQILSRVAHFLDPELQFFPKGNISREDFNGSGFFNMRPTSFSSEDGLGGKYHGVPLRVSELNATRKQGKHTTTIFRGFMMEAQMPFHLNAHIGILERRKVEKSGFAKFFDNLWGSKKAHLFNLQSGFPPFDHHFVIQSDRPEVAQHWLGPSLVEGFLQMTHIPHTSIMFKLSGDRALMAMGQQTDNFELSAFKSMLDPVKIKGFFLLMHGLLNTVYLMGQVRPIEAPAQGPPPPPIPPTAPPADDLPESRWKPPTEPGEVDAPD